MAIVKCKQIAAGRAGDGKSDSRTYNVVFSVVVSDPYDGVATIGNHPALPGRFAPYVGFENTDDPAALCTSVRPEQDGDDWQKWKVVCTFETSKTNSSNQPAEDPEDDLPIEWVEFEYERQKVTKEYDGTDIKNSAGELIDGLEIDKQIKVLCFERNHRFVSPLIDMFNQSTNSDLFRGNIAGTCRARITAGRPEFRNGIQFFKHVYRILVNPDGWDPDPADRGTKVLNSSNKLERPTDSLNAPFDGEVFLDGNGKQLSEGAEIVYLGKKKLLTPLPYSLLQLGF